MAKRTTANWLAVALHYGEPWEEFLIKAVKPFVRVALQAGIAESFYFERSWDNGPHILMWFKVNPSIFHEILKPNLEEHFLQYFESRPSTVKVPYYPADYPAERRWLPNNSVQYPEINNEKDHFDGFAEVDIFEKHYMASSLLVLDTLHEKSARWTYNEMISSAMKQHLSFIYGIGMDCAEAQHFLEFVSEKWFAGNCKSEQEKAKVKQTFDKIFRLQRKDTVPYLSALWEMFNDFELMDKGQLVEWVKVNTNMNVELELALESKKLRPNRTLQKMSIGKYPPKWDYLERLMKSTNNRMGLFNKNEGYMLYALAESMALVTDSIQTMHKLRV